MSSFRCTVCLPAFSESIDLGFYNARDLGLVALLMFDAHRIVVLIWGSFVPSVFYGFAGDMGWVRVYWTMVRAATTEYRSSTF